MGDHACEDRGRGRQAPIGMRSTRQRLRAVGAALGQHDGLELALRRRARCHAGHFQHAMVFSVSAAAGRKVRIGAGAKGEERRDSRKTEQQHNRNGQETSHGLIVKQARKLIFKVSGRSECNRTLDTLPGVLRSVRLLHLLQQWHLRKRRSGGRFRRQRNLSHGGLRLHWLRGLRNIR